jgi:hypothetical protein
LARILPILALQLTGKPAKTPEMYGFLPPQKYGLWSIGELWVSIMEPTWWIAKKYGVSQIMGYQSYGLRQL